MTESREERFAWDKQLWGDILNQNSVLVIKSNYLILGMFSSVQCSQLREFFFLKNISLMSSELHMFVIVIFPSWLKQTAVWGELKTEEWIDWLVVQCSKEPEIPDIIYYKKFEWKSVKQKRKV